MTACVTQRILVLSYWLYLGALVFGSPSAAERMVTATVEMVRDGDTLVVRDSSQKSRTVRLVCIDAPEFTQEPWGLQATQYLERILLKGDTVQLRVVETDTYDRWIAEVFKGEQSVNLQMVTAGQAVVYRQYLDNCGATQANYLAAEATAREQKQGFWNQSKPEMPWNYRHRQPK